MMTKGEIATLLSSLGMTANMVADTLLSLGIRGNKKRCRECPIAQFLIKNNIPFSNDTGVSTSFFRIVAAGYTYYFEEYPNLCPIGDFIVAFDNGKYPQLETP